MRASGKCRLFSHVVAATGSSQSLSISRSSVSEAVYTHSSWLLPSSSPSLLLQTRTIFHSIPARVRTGEPKWGTQRVAPAKLKEEEEDEDDDDLFDAADLDFKYDEESEPSGSEEERKFRRKIDDELADLDADLTVSAAFPGDEEVRDEEWTAEKLKQEDPAEAFKRRMQDKLRKEMQKEERSKDKAAATKQREQETARLRKAKTEQMIKKLESYLKGHQTVPARVLIAVLRKMQVLRVSKEDEAKLMALLVPLTKTVTCDSVKTYTTLITAFARRKQLDASLRIWQRMKDTEHEKKMLRLTKLLSKEEQANAQFHLDVYVYNAIISACVQNNRLSEGLSFFAELMQRWKDEKQRHEAKGNKKKGTHDMDEKVDTGRYKPTVITFSILLSAFAKAGDVKRTNELLGIMEEERVPPDAHVFNTLLSLNARKGDLAEAMKLVDVMRAKKLTPDEVTYTCLVRASVMHAANVLPTLRDPNTMQRKEAALFAKATAFLDNVVKMMGEANVRPDGEFVKALVNAYGTFAATDKMFEVLSILHKEEGIVPDANVYSIMIVHCGRLQRMDDVYRVFDLMNLQRSKPSQANLQDFFKACRACERPKDAAQVFSFLKGWVKELTTFDEQFFFDLFNTYEGVTPPSIQQLGEGQAQGKAEAEEGEEEGEGEKEKKYFISEETFRDVFAAMGGAGFRPTLTVYNALVHTYGLNGNVERCWQVLERMRQRYIQPNQLTYRYLIYAQINAPQQPQQQHLQQQQQQQQEGKKDGETASDPNGKEALQIFREMKKDRVPLDAKVFNSLIRLCAKQNNPKEAYELFLLMRREGVQTNITTLRNVIEACKHDHSYFSEVEQLSQLLTQLTSQEALPSPRPTPATTPPTVRAMKA